MGYRRTVCVQLRKVATARCGLERKVDSQDLMAAERKSLRIPHCPAAACFLSRLMMQEPYGLEPTQVLPAYLLGPRASRPHQGPSDAPRRARRPRSQIA